MLLLTHSVFKNFKETSLKNLEMGNTFNTLAILIACTLMYIVLYNFY